MKHKIIIAVTAAFLTFSVGVSAAETKTASKPEDTYQLLNLFSDVFEKVRSDYVEETTDEELIKSAIQGMLSSLDPHSSYMDADRFKDMQVQTKGQFGGLGIQVTMDESGAIKVISPIDDTPAFRAGLKAGDLILELDGETVLGMTLNDAVDKMRGPVGTDIKITVRRGEKKPFSVTLTRAIIHVESVRSRLEGEVGYVRITSFTERTEAGLKKAIDSFNTELGDRLKGIVLDLRNNPGGLLDQAIAVSDAFLERGEVVSTRSRRIEDINRYNARPGDLADGLPLVVLINGGSASASEIVAGALQDHGRAIILGTRSFGKGSVQTIVPLGQHGAMRLTTSRYFTPSGRSIQAVGIEPDILVEAAKIEKIEQPAHQRREADLRGRLDNPGQNGEKTNGAKPAAKPSDTPAETPAEETDETTAPTEDYQLSRALDLIRGVALFSEMPRATAE